MSLRFASIPLLLLYMVPVGAQSPTGSIVGRVRDSLTQRPIAHARVAVEGTSHGATADSTGRYRIDDVPAGTVSLRATYVAYKPRELVGLVVVAGRSIEQDVVLEPSPVMLNTIEVTGSVNPLVPHDIVTTKQSITGDMVRSVSTDRINQALSLRSGRALQGGYPGSESYDRIVENQLQVPSANPLSTFAIDVDHAAYSNVRRMIGAGQLPPKDAVRIEEMVNYFPYDYAPPSPADPHPLRITTEVAAAPWNPAHRIVRIGLQAAKVETADLPRGNYIFLLDVSGSMEPENRLPLVKAAMRLVVDQLRPQDQVSIVTYAGDAGIRLMPTSGADKLAILDAIDHLAASGSTNGGAGLRLAYDVARKSQVRGGNNRIILATDGDFNVGLSSDAEMEQLIEQERQDGIFLTVLGVGYGNLKDSKLERIADKGNGNYAYLDNLLEAHKVLVHEMGGTLLTVAKDVKVQVEFNPATVAAYRLIGYEDRLLEAPDFKNDRKDAGEIGAGHSVTALYEVMPAGGTSSESEPMRYQPQTGNHPTAHGNELLYVRIRYKRPGSDVSTLLEQPVADRVMPASLDLRFATAVAEFGMLLRNSDYRGDASVDAVLELARGAIGTDPFGYRASFVGLVEAFRRLPATVSVR